MIIKEKIAGIVVTYNIDKDTLLKNIDTYINYIDLLIIIDNSDIKTKISQIFENRIKYISMNGNQGIAKALNTGIEYAISKDYEYVLTMDQDSKFNNNLIDEYKKYYSKDIIIYAPKYIIDRKKTKKYKTNTIELYWTMTSGNLLNLELYKKVGKFKEDFFIDGVDYEYCLRAKKYKCRMIQCNKAELKHNPGITKEKKILFWNYKYGYMNPIRLYYQVRNFYWIQKEYKCFAATKILIIRLLKIILLFDNKKKFFLVYKRGKSDFKNGKFGKFQE